MQPELELNYERAFEAVPEENAHPLCLTGGVVSPFGDGYRIAAGLQYALWGSHTGQSMSVTLASKWAF